MLTITTKEAAQVADLGRAKKDVPLHLARLAQGVLLVTRSDNSAAWRILADGTIRKMPLKKGLAA